MRSFVSQAALENKQQEGFRTIEGFLPDSAVSVSVSAKWCFIARQAICNRNNQIFGYELLARSGWKNRFMEDSDSASRRMIVEGVMHGFDGLTQGPHGFINCTRESLVEGLVALLPKSTVLELLETVLPDHEVIAACTDIHRQGYQLALDDFRIMPGMEALVDLASYIKIDFRLSDKEQRREIISYLKGCKAKLIAEKVETEAEFKSASDEGFQLFQGYFFCRPETYSSRRTDEATCNQWRPLYGPRALRCHRIPNQAS